MAEREAGLREEVAWAAELTFAARDLVSAHSCSRPSPGALRQLGFQEQGTRLSGGQGRAGPARRGPAAATFQASSLLSAGASSPEVSLSSTAVTRALLCSSGPAPSCILCSLPHSSKPSP